MALAALRAKLDGMPEALADELPGETWTQLREGFSRPFLALHLAAELYTARVALALALDLGWDTKLRAGTDADEILAGLPAQCRIPVRWMLGFLADQGLLTREGDRVRLNGEPQTDLAEIRAFAADEAGPAMATFDLLDRVRAVIPPFFTLGKPGEPLLFDLTTFPLWLAYFRNDNPVYRPNNLLPLMALRDRLPEGARVLEIGAGSGSFLRMLHEDGTAKGYLSRIAGYRFTDVAPAFLRRAQRELAAEMPGLNLSFGPFDLNGDFDAQGIEDGSLDAIVGVNVLHVAKQLPRALKDLRRKLRPGGLLAFGECLKPSLDEPIYLEFLFNFMDSFRGVELDPVLRPVHGFLTPEQWRVLLEHAGFRDIRAYPDARAIMDKVPDFFVGGFGALA
ncbi:MAG TPA: class I SAM-dependent methyltransferase [Holophagaceae bacterium]|nr:class I SAM-dependent methyltransferase [Holophagaceae bacterium]